MKLDNAARDRVYTHCSRAISNAGTVAESLFLSRLALLLFEQIGDEAACLSAIDEALSNLPQPSLSSLQVWDDLA